MDVVVLGEDEGAGFAVDLGAGGDEDARASVRLGEPEDVAGEPDVAFDGPDGVGEDEVDADGGGEVVDLVEGRVVREGGEGGGEVLLDEPDGVEAGGEIVAAPGGEVVDDDDVVAALDEAFDEVGADEPGAARDERTARPGGARGVARRGHRS
ncbi:MAG: hypothetical protein R3B49_05630 [Phycisphaerales bacterium]